MLTNPFSYEAATNLDIDNVLSWYIPDHNQGPLINSSKNLFLFGERGCGKSMTLRYFSLEAEISRAAKSGTTPDLSFVGIYVKCNAPLIWKREYELIKRDDEGRAKAALLSEHILSLWILRSLIEQICLIPNLFKNDEEVSNFSSRLSFLMDIELPQNKTCLSVLCDHLEKRLDQVQFHLAEKDPGQHLSSFRGFNSLVVQVLIRLKSLGALSNSHFMIMLDDAQDLYSHQREAVNSWIAYRDHSIFSIKVAVARKQSYDFCTSNGSAILEIHDFSSLDLQTPYQNSSSNYAKFVDDVLTTRLKNSGIDTKAMNFFPKDSTFETEIKSAQKECQDSYIAAHPNATPKQINDYVYKRGRAHYFKKRSPKANRPVYAGLETITEVSTGVTRNVLEIAWRAFDLYASEDRSAKSISFIPSQFQSEAIFKCSDKLWASLSEGLEKRSARITSEDSKKLHNLFNQLGLYFRERLISDISEPRVLSFVLSDLKKDHELTTEIKKILSLAFEHTLLFSRPYVSRDGGISETLYTPNKLLWPTFGLDVVGQSGRASIKVSEIYLAMNNKKIPLSNENDSDVTGQNQLGLDYE